MEDYKEKYEMALEGVQEILSSGQDSIKMPQLQLRLQGIFPELKNKDEEIRKALIRFHKSTIDVDGIKGDDILAWLEKQGEQKSVDKVEPFDKYEGLTDFERTLADICIGWIGEELGWKQYIKDNADVLLKIAIKKFNSIQDAPFEQKPAWSDEDEEKLQDCIGAIWAADYYLYEDKQEMEAWIKSLKDRIGG